MKITYLKDIIEIEENRDSYGCGDGPGDGEHSFSGEGYDKGYFEEATDEYVEIPGNHFFGGGNGVDVGDIFCGFGDGDGLVYGYHSGQCSGDGYGYGIRIYEKILFDRFVNNEDDDLWEFRGDGTPSLLGKIG